MKFIIPLAIATVFVILGVISVFSPTTIKNHLNKSHMEGLKDFGASDNYAEEYVKKSVVQHNLIYRIIGIIMMVCGSLLFYAVIKKSFES